MFWVTGTASVFMWGALGGGVAILVASFFYLLVQSTRGAHGMPERFKRLAFWMAAATCVFLGGIAAWLQGSLLLNLHTLSLQIGLGWPAFVSAVWRFQDDPPPGTVS